MATVEFAFVAPLIFLLFFAGVEFGRVLMAVHGLEAAAREGCREAISWGITQTDVEQTVAERMGTFGISGYALATDPRPVTGASQWQPITVRITVPYDQVSWLPLPGFLKDITLAGSCTLLQEQEPEEA